MSMEVCGSLVQNKVTVGTVYYAPGLGYAWKFYNAAGEPVEAYQPKYKSREALKRDLPCRTKAVFF